MSNRELAEYFLFTRKERIAILSLIVLIAGTFFVPMILPATAYKKSVSEEEFEQARSQLDDVMKKNRIGNIDDKHEDAIQNASSFPNNKSQLFSFDPNTINGSGWKKLGLPERTILTIQRYLSKGGRFRKPEDIQKIYGISSAMTTRLIPYIDIESNKKPENFQSSKNSYSNSSDRSNLKGDYRNSPIDINAADTTMLISLPGIGSKLAQRIINFREKLGGFYSVNQVAETFGLSDSVFQKNKERFICEIQTIRKVNINTATVEELKLHPYIKWNLANAIVAYRKQHGSFQTTEQLNQLAILKEEALVKLLPYLCVQ
ncbi:MAG: helix-hairpin-helix domain-containing protein [Chitinophagaceae bacterium]